MRHIGNGRSLGEKREALIAEGKQASCIDARQIDDIVDEGVSRVDTKSRMISLKEAVVLLPISEAEVNTNVSAPAPPVRRSVPEPQ